MASRRVSLRRRRDAERRKRFGLLLVSIAAVFAIEGISKPSPGQEITVSVLLTVTLIASLRVAEAPRSILVPIALVSVGLLIAGVIGALVEGTDSVAVAVANLLLVIIAPPAIVIGTVRTLREHHSVTVDAVFGVLCLYLLLGMMFAFLYVFLGRVHGGSFFAQNSPASTPDCLYFSFTTLTTVGYGDLTAKSNLGRTLSVSEALVGQIYLVTVVSLIVGQLGFAARRGPSSDEAGAAVAGEPGDSTGLSEQ